MRSLFFGCLVLISGCGQIPQAERPEAASAPAWVADAVFYQIFPERFRNGDTSNDPIRESMDYLEYVPSNWRVSGWTSEWFARDSWEEEKSDDFYETLFDRRYGGDLQGVIDKLDYLEDLGVNAIYFNPVFHARSLHKYDGSSFHHVDAYFGPDPEGDIAMMSAETQDPSTWSWTSADLLFLELLGEARERGIRVVIDGVWNHTGRGFFAFEDLRAKQEESGYRDWYIVNGFDDEATEEDEFSYDAWWGYESLPEFANSADGSNLAAGPKAYIMAATRRWMDPNNDGDPADGIAGWRLDVAEDVPNGFWREWNEYVREINPQTYTVAEMWLDASAKIIEGGFSATMNYHAFAMPVKGFLIDGLLPASQFAQVVTDRRLDFDISQQFGTLNLIDSHDTVRLASWISNRVEAYEEPDRFDYGVGTSGPRDDSNYQVSPPSDEDRAIQRLVALFQMTFPGAPMLYYGTEAGMWGANDPDDRMPMFWEDLEYDDQTLGPFGQLDSASPIGFDHDLFAYYKTLIELRSAHGALRNGSFEVIYTSDEDQTLVFSRESEDTHLIVAINRGASHADVTLEEVGAASGWEALFQTGLAEAASDITGKSLRMPARSGFVMRVR